MPLSQVGGKIAAMEKAEKIIVGVTGSVAAYKAAELTRLFIRENLRVQVVMTKSATQLITPATFRALSGRPVLIDEWTGGESPDGMDHIAVTRDSAALVIAPASANFLARIANGICDDLLSAAVAASACPIFAAPAMNAEMWKNPATQRNIVRLAEDGITLIGPADGEQACGEFGFGRMSAPEEICRIVLSGIRGGDSLSGRRILVSVGATAEAIDPMRIITNRSSGRMGFAVAKAACELGAKVKIIAGTTTIPPPAGIPIVFAKTADEMRQAVLGEAKNADIFISAAAVSDYRPRIAARQKSRRSDGEVILTLVPTADILAEVAAMKSPPFCVGFAAESGNLIAAAKRKMRVKKLPMIVANDAEKTADADDCELVIVDSAGAAALPRLSKRAAAKILVGKIADAFAEKSARRRAG